jgi:hypothetical protein
VEAVSGQPSAVSDQPSAVSNQQSAAGGRQPEINSRALMEVVVDLRREANLFADRAKDLNERAGLCRQIAMKILDCFPIRPPTREEAKP